MKRMWLVVTVAPSTGRPLGCPGLAVEFTEPCLFETKEEAEYVSGCLSTQYPSYVYGVGVGKVSRDLLKRKKRR